MLTQLVDRNYRSKAAEAHLSSGQLLVLDLLSGHVSLGLEEFKNKNLNQVLAEHKVKLNQLINSEQTNQKFHPNLIPVQSGTPAQQNFTDTRPSKEGTQSTTGQPTSIQQTTLQSFDTGITQKPAQNLSQAAAPNSVTTSEKVLATETNPELLVGNAAKGTEGLLTDSKTPKSSPGDTAKTPAPPQVNAPGSDKSNGTNEITPKAKDTNPDKEKPKNQDNKGKNDKNSKGNSQQNLLLTLLSKPLQWSGLFV
ncbi:MAG TPA: hypothetical protein VNU93_03780 [Verrucomicrobiae bacterium]|nr:hypothetical protein [Verrucomicrobiae bacterium]